MRLVNEWTEFVGARPLARVFIYATESDTSAGYFIVYQDGYVVQQHMLGGTEDAIRLALAELDSEKEKIRKGA